MVDIHADDYGLFVRESERILECCEHGALTGVSVMTNGPHLQECMEMLEKRCPQLTLTVHINFYDGRALTPACEVPLLTGEDGVFRISFGRLVLASYFPFRRMQYLEQLKKELRAQIRALEPWDERLHQPLRLDGHGHYHMIPIVFDALVQVLEEDHLKVAYIREPYEELSMYRPIRGQLTKIRPVNLVKVAVMNHFVKRNRRKYPEVFASLQQHVFSGILFSGNNCYQNASAILPVLTRLAGERGCSAELLFHPGGVEEEEDLAQVTIGKDYEFFTSEGRRLEYEAVRRLKTD